MRAWNALLARCGRGNIQAPTPFKGGFLVPIPPTLLSVVGGGTFNPIRKGGKGPVSFYTQFAYPSPGTALANVGMSNALRIDLKP